MSSNADTARDGRTRLARPNSQAQTGTDREIFVFRITDHKQDWQPHLVDPYTAIYIYVIVLRTLWGAFVLQKRYTLYKVIDPQLA